MNQLSANTLIYQLINNRFRVIYSNTKGGNNMKNVIKIPSYSKLSNHQLRVAAYARVSHTYLLQSLSNQVSYYNELIQSNPNWEYVGVYVDEAVSGQSLKKRNEFKRLIKDCREGKIDVILTKSISRFGRNTVDLLKTIRELKSLNVSVRFENENIDTLTTDGELLLTLLATKAEEEAKSTSDNVRWKVKQKFEQGLPYIPQDMFGYRWEIDHYEIERNEASIIQDIFQQYIEGNTTKTIVESLNDRNLKTRKGNNFSRSVVHKILNQEAYTGILLLQKTYVDSQKGRSVPNTGKRTQFIVEEAHEPIISKELFDNVQKEKARRNLRQKGERDE